MCAALERHSKQASQLRRKDRYSYTATQLHVHARGPIVHGRTIEATKQKRIKGKTPSKTHAGV